jgi:hypothetical protein
MPTREHSHTIICGKITPTSIVIDARSQMSEYLRFSFFLTRYFKRNKEKIDTHTIKKM